jgi:DNA-binding Lrp family transcriptional regulator
MSGAASASPNSRTSLGVKHGATYFLLRISHAGDRWSKCSPGLLVTERTMAALHVQGVRTSHEHIKSCLKRFSDIPHIVEVHRVTGDDCFVLKVLVPAPEDLETIVDRIAGFGTVTTSVVLRSEPVRPIGKDLVRKKTERS